MLGIRVANRPAVPCRPGADTRPGPVGFDPDLDSMSGLERLVDRCRGHSLAAVGVGEADVARRLEDDWVVDAVARRGPVAAVDVADEVRVRIAPAQHRVVWSHD